MNPTNWNDDPNINEVEALNRADEACLDEIRDVLKKHNKTSRFGVTLLHSHFRLAKDEVLLEHISESERTLMSRPVRLTEMASKDYRPTVWRFDGEKAHGCSYCPTDANGRHHGSKEPC